MSTDKRLQIRKSVVLLGLIGSLLLAMAFTQAVIPAYGHALPATYSIAPNSIISKDSPPAGLTISFSERPDPKTSYIRVLNSQNQRIDNDDFTATGRQATVTLDTAKFTDGIYTVSWRTMSLDDGHIAQGSYVFGFGSVSLGGDGGVQPTQETTTFVTSTADALLRWPMIVSQAAVVGGILAYFVLGRRLSHVAIQPKKFAYILIASAVAIAVCGTSLLLLQASNLVEDSSQSTFLATVQTLIQDSPAGLVWIIRLIGTAVIAGLAAIYAVTGGKKPYLLWPILAAGAISIFSNSMLSHNSAATFLPSLAVATDWVHFMAVSAWVGGLFYFSALLYPALKQGPGAYGLALALPRFSLLAILSLGIIGVSGLYMAWIHLQSLDALFYTQYGNNLIIKLASAVPMLILGGYHQVKLHSGITAMAMIGRRGGSSAQDANLHSGNNDAVSRFGKTIKIESIIAIGVLFAASLLTITSPPSHSHMGQPGTPGEVPAGFSQKATVNGVDLSISISPFQVGVNTFSVSIREGGQAPENINAVFLRLRNSDSGTGPIVATLNQTGSGIYSITGGFLGQAGNWDIDLIVQRIGAYDLNHSFEASLVAAAGHDMDMDDMNMEQMEDASGNSLGTMENEQPAPTFDSFAMLTVVLAGAVIGSSAYFYKRSQNQLRDTLRVLRENK